LRFVSVRLALIEQDESFFGGRLAAIMSSHFFKRVIAIIPPRFDMWFCQPLEHEGEIIRRHQAKGEHLYLLFTILL
jgi:hypothetical protein